MCRKPGAAFGDHDEGVEEFAVVFEKFRLF
jgi:hypothetical protein